MTTDLLNLLRLRQELESSTFSEFQRLYGGICRWFRNEWLCLCPNGKAGRRIRVRLARRLSINAKFTLMFRNEKAGGVRPVLADGVDEVDAVSAWSVATKKPFGCVIADLALQFGLLDRAQYRMRLLDLGVRLKQKIGKRSHRRCAQPLFRLRGNVWKVRFEGKHGSFKDSIGMRHLHKLLQGRGKPQCLWPGLQTMLQGMNPESFQAILDSEAREAVQEDVVEATKAVEAARGDTRAEMEAKRNLSKIIAARGRDTKPSGAPRGMKSSSPFAKANSSAWKAITRTINQLREAGFQRLADHFKLSIRKDSRETIMYDPADPAPRWKL